MTGKPKYEDEIIYPFVSDSDDKDRSLDFYGPTIGRCKGGRLLVKGYKCPHCGSFNPDRECRSPKKEEE